MTKKSLPFIVVSICLLLVAGVSVADRDESNPPGSDVRQVTVIEPEVREAAAVFERERTASDAIPDRLARALDAHADFGMNPGLSRLSIGNATHAVYAVPGRGHVCAVLTVGEGANMMCPSVDQLTGGKAGPTTVALGDGVAIYGLVPDGIESVTVLTGTSTSTEVPVERNAYFTVVRSGVPLRSVRQLGPEGPVDFEIVDPSLVFEDEEAAAE